MPKQDKVQIINQRRRRPTDSLGVSGAGGAFVPPGTITLTTGNTVGTTHTHELDIESLASLGLGHVLRIVAATGTVVDYGVTTEDALTGALGAGAAGWNRAQGSSSSAVQMRRVRVSAGLRAEALSWSKVSV